MKHFKYILLAASLVFSQGAFAHTDEYLDTQKAPHGGQLRMAGIYHFELLVALDGDGMKESPVIVYLTDHAGTKIASVGATGTATILAGKEKTIAVLKPDGENRMRGAARYVSSPDMKVVIAVTPPGKQAEQARFTPLAIVKHGQHGH